MRRATASLALVFLTAAPLGAAPILVNGSFELGPAMNGPACSIAPASCGDVDVLAGSTLIPGWTVFGDGIDYNGPPWAVSDGLHSIDLDGRNALFSGVAQTFGTTVGQTYIVSFDLSGNPDGGPVLKRARVAVAGITNDYTFDSSGQTLTTLKWESIRFSFVALDTATTLSFMSLTGVPNSFGALIDNVRVTVPDAASVLVAMPGLLLLAVRRRRSRAPESDCDDGFQKPEME